jgi:hypothetical protein
MKRIALFIFIISIIQLFNSCDKIIPDLKRDNPNDSHFTGDNSEGKRTLAYYSHNVACKEIGEPPYIEYSDENIINSGDKIWLNIVLKNTSNLNISGINATASSTSSLIEIVPLTPTYFLKFGESSNSDDISSGKTGWGEITDGQYYNSAPNYNSYSVEFSVSAAASTGDTIPIKLNVKDELGNEWSLNFNILID